MKANPFAFAYVPFLLEVQIKRQEIVARLKKCIERLEFLKTAERLKTRKECLKKLQKVIDRLKKRKKLGKGFITIFPVYKQNVKHVTYNHDGALRVADIVTRRGQTFVGGDQGRSAKVLVALFRYTQTFRLLFRHQRRIGIEIHGQERSQEENFV